MSENKKAPVTPIIEGETTDDDTVETKAKGSRTQTALKVVAAGALVTALGVVIAKVLSEPVEEDEETETEIDFTPTETEEA